MATAITAHLHGLDVLLIEKDELLGGSTAFSYGTLWIPGNPVAARAGIPDDREAAVEYLRNQMGSRFDQERMHAYLEQAPRMVDYFESHSAVRFICRADFPDYQSEQRGAAAGGRTIMIEPYDGRELGSALFKLRPPMPTQTLWGMMYTPMDLKLLFAVLKSWHAFRHIAWRVSKHLRDLLKYGRTTWLTNGNALAGRLLKTVAELKIPVKSSATMRELIVEHGRVCGALIEQDGRRIKVQARCGVVLACGGFGRDVARCKELLARPPLAGQDWSMAPPGNSGDGLRTALDVGAQIDRDMINAAFWAPVSRSPVSSSAALAGHFHDRHRPGFIAVTRLGRRFANEASSNHHFAEAIVRATELGEEPIAYLICDHRAIRQVGCGDLIFPAPASLKPHLRSGYLIQANSVRELSTRLGIDPETLTGTIDEFNRHAREGRDPLFGKGDTAFNRYFGDSIHRPNACLGALDQAPYYAVQMTAGHMGTLAGLKTDLCGRTLDESSVPIPGLYAVGNDMANIFGGACPGGGITLGPGMTFGYIIGQHMAGVHIDGISE